ncbi:recombinase RecT [Streptomyces sp. NBC_01754]|uniref:recombinase RecT n=1 Tax=Streptomyces sp. NBC_01754 TaxID=2975930 RepID=UPI002DDB6814|nr:recombinase RecT [Streptomyces sp. NBC_01754]WSC92972.1 recombinase RecT [Streptomyces sp. NBC_01754]
MTIAPAERQQTPATYAAARGAHGGALSLSHMTPREAWTFCESLAATPLLPDAYRKQPASVLWAMEYGRALGLDVVTTITTIHVIKGKPCQSADLMLGRARSAGHRVRIKSERTRCVVSIQRHDDPDDETVIEWTLDDAVTAGLCTIKSDRPYSRDQKNQPQPWEKYPRAMLRARAIAECVRSACPEVLHGAIYTPEELGEVVDQEGNPVVVVDRADAPVQQTATVVQSTPNTPPPPARDYLAEAVVAAWDELDEIEEAARVNGAPGPYMAALADVRTAHAAQDVKAVRELHRTLQEAGAEPAHLSRIAAIGATKPGAKAPGQAPPVADDGSRHADDSHRDAPDPAEQAEQALRLAASRANLPTLDEDFEMVYNLPIAKATAQQLNTFRERIEAAGGAQ